MSALFIKSNIAINSHIASLGYDVSTWKNVAYCSYLPPPPPSPSLPLWSSFCHRSDIFSISWSGLMSCDEYNASTYSPLIRLIYAKRFVLATILCLLYKHCSPLYSYLLDISLRRNALAFYWLSSRCASLARSHCDSSNPQRLQLVPPRLRFVCYGSVFVLDWGSSGSIQACHTEHSTAVACRQVTRT